MKNILDNMNYPNLEFVLLDYNSTDGLNDYIIENFSEFINTGRLIYYKTTTSRYFRRSHSRNVVFKLAKGDIICNVDADNYTGKGFAAYVNKEFVENKDIFLTTINVGIDNKDVLGRICVRKIDFEKVKGYDERLICYGFEDNDFANRLNNAGLKGNKINKDIFLQCVSHDDTQRLSNEYVFLNLHTLIFNYLTHSSTDCILLFNDHSFKRGTMLENKHFNFTGPIDDLRRSQLLYEYSILQDNWIEGKWELSPQMITLHHGDQIEQLIFCDSTDCFISNNSGITSFFYKINKPELIQQAIMFFSQITNRIIMSRNKLLMATIVNCENYGKDQVYRNFSAQSLIV